MSLRKNTNITKEERQKAREDCLANGGTLDECMEKHKATVGDLVADANVDVLRENMEKTNKKRFDEYIQTQIDEDSKKGFLSSIKNKILPKSLVNRMMKQKLKKENPDEYKFAKSGFSVGGATIRRKKRCKRGSRRHKITHRCRKVKK
jgi:hypothetical protein